MPLYKSFDFFAEGNILHSFGGTSTFFYHRSTQCLFDCGISTVTTLGVKIFNINHIFITHSHFDHVAGLRTFIHFREKFMGANDKKLTIWTTNYRGLMNELRDIPDWVTVSPIKAGQEVSVKPNTFVKALKSNHTDDSVVYVCFQLRKKILPSGMELVNAKRTQELNDSHYRFDFFPRFGFLTDCPAYREEWMPYLNKADFIIYDCTFLEDKDRKDKNHATLEMCMEAARVYDAKMNFYAHISQRYDIRRYESKLAQERECLVPYHTPVIIEHNI